MHKDMADPDIVKNNTVLDILEIADVKLAGGKPFNKHNAIAVYNFSRLHNYQSRQSLWPDRKA